MSQKLSPSKSFLELFLLETLLLKLMTHHTQQAAKYENKKRHDRQWLSLEKSLLLPYWSLLVLPIMPQDKLRHENNKLWYPVWDSFKNTNWLLL